MRLGYASILTAVVIWAGWMVATRFAVNEAVAPLDLALIRYAVPALCLAPWWMKCGLVPRQTPLWALIMMMGWGAPFVIFMAMAMQTASVAHVAAIVPCMMPLIAAALSWALFRERFGLSERIGFALIAVGAAFVGVPLVLGGESAALGNIGLRWVELASHCLSQHRARLAVGRCGDDCVRLCHPSAGTTEGVFVLSLSTGTGRADRVSVARRGTEWA